MKTLRTASAAIAILLAIVAEGSGPLGHVTMARHTIEGILSGQIGAPADLREILKDPEAARAYCGGSIGPDLDESAHYKKTSEIPIRMIAAAKADLAKATKSGKPDLIRAAREELAFSYGWMNHSAADLNIHPVINSMTGDTYRYNGAAGKALHAEIEGQFTAFLAHGGPLPAYDPKVPVDFVARTAFMSKSTITTSMKVLGFKAATERKFSEKLAPIAPDLEGAFRLVEAGAMADNRWFLRSPKNLKDWDLDCGRITTNEFETLREATMRANGGKLPANWGAMYLTWHQRTAGLLLAQKIKIMTAILGGAGVPTRTDPEKAKVDPNAIPKGGAWVLQRSEFSVQYPDSQMDPARRVSDSGSSGMGNSQATFGHPDPTIFVTVRIKVAWTIPEPTLIPGKTYKWRFAIFDAGSDDNRGLYVGGSGSLGTNCPAMSDVWYGPAASIDLREKKYQGEATKEFTPKSAPDGAEMYVTASWSTGIRAAYYTYVYRFKAE